ncbi:MAG: sulfatase-like hydrolase/transferase, partial [Actinobacteria bacterium]|nr:sulfatase-like hydrolase/transferase [Actinomycetota bacterium]
GTLDDTVIVLTTDHIPYAYTEVMDEIAGYSLDKTFELYENELIVWSSTMEEPVYVTRPCESIDILPTMLNLLGIDFDSRLIIGRDALSDSDTFVMFQDRSWISDKGRYDADTGTWYPSTEEAVGQDYLDAMNIRVRNSFDASSQILETNYYSYIDAYLTETATQ